MFEICLDATPHTDRWTDGHTARIPKINTSLIDECKNKVSFNMTY
jgi:hypothetical protein